MDLEYRLDGPSHAPVLVLSNSLGTTWEMWDEQWTTFIQHFRVLRYNTRGHGQSPITGRDMNLATFGQDVVVLLNHLNIERAAFCGVSLGGMTGLWLNRHYPERFTHFIIANSAAKIGTRENWLARAEDVRTHGMATVAQSSPQRWFTEAYIAAKPGVVEHLTDQLAAMIPSHYALCCEVLAGADLRADLSGMACPMLVVAGEQDPVTSPAQAQEIVTATQQSLLALLPTSHISPIGCPVGFTRLAMEFLTQDSRHEAEH